jgi:hypothetical protein
VDVIELLLQEVILSGFDHKQIFYPFFFPKRLGSTGEHRRHAVRKGYGTVEQRNRGMEQWNSVKTPPETKVSLKAKTEPPKKVE